MQVYSGKVGTIPVGTMATNTITGTMGNLSRIIHFENEYHIYKYSYTLPGGDVMTEVRLCPTTNKSNRPRSGDYLLYLKHFYDATEGTRECMLGNMEILQGCRSQDGMCLANATFQFAMYDYETWDILLYPGRFVDVPNSTVLAGLYGSPEHPGVEPLHGIPYGWMTTANNEPYKRLINSDLNAYVPSVSTMSVNPSPTILSREFQGDIINEMISFQHDYMYLMYDKVYGSLVVCNIQGLIAPRSMSEEADIERHLRWICDKWNLNSVTISLSMDEIIYISIVNNDLSVETDVISIPLFVLTSYCMIEQTSSEYII